MSIESDRKMRMEAFSYGRNRTGGGQMLSNLRELSEDANQALTREQLEEKAADETIIFRLLSAQKDRKLTTKESEALEQLQNKWTNKE